MPINFTWLVVALISLRLAMEWWLEGLNQAHVKAHSQKVPDAFTGMLDEPTYQKSVAYTLAGSRFSQWQTLWEVIVLLAALFSGVLPWAFALATRWLGDAAWAQALYLLAAGFSLGLISLPFDWYHQFRLEQRFGFNTTTAGLWMVDRLKGWLLAFVLGWPLVALLIKLVEWTGAAWWLWGWAVFMGFQLLLMVLAPVLILPLFYKFSALPEGSLRERLLRMADRAGFQTSGIQVMDGSRRSRHSNAFFTGFGRFRRIVLFDTLIEQLGEAELEAVLAHEIGHYKLRHIPKMLALSAAGSLASFYLLGLLARQAWFVETFGFDAGLPAPVLLVFALLAGTIGFWISPLSSCLSRKHEYEADAFAARAVGGGNALVRALRKLTEKNLGNLTPHPFYSGFYYSHPTLLEREKALTREHCEVAAR